MWLCQFLTNKRLVFVIYILSGLLPHLTNSDSSAKEKSQRAFNILHGGQFSTLTHLFLNNLECGENS